MILKSTRLVLASLSQTSLEEGASNADRRCVQEEGTQTVCGMEGPKDSYTWEAAQGLTSLPHLYLALLDHGIELLQTATFRLLIFC